LPSEPYCSLPELNFAYLINANEIFLYETIGQQCFNLRVDACESNSSINIACGSNDVVEDEFMDSTLTIGLSLIFSIVLFGPFLNKTIEGNLEAFLFIMGVISATLSRAWSSEVVREGLIAPINITLAVIGAGVLFHYLRGFIDHGMRRVLITCHFQR